MRIQYSATTLGWLMLGVLFPLQAVKGQQASENRKVDSMVSKEFLQRLVGKWEGECKTWFEPDKLADQSMLQGEFQSVFGGKFVRHVYQGQILDKPRHGEELIALNGVTKQFQIAWIDDFHMNYAIMRSEGPATENGFNVIGPYDVAENEPPWSWRTVFALEDDDHLTITAYNVDPKGNEAKAVEVKYKRVKN